MHKFFPLLISLFFFAGCASIPESVSGDNFMQITPEQARTNPDKTNGANVRWGGVIVEVINNESETWIEVLGMPLSNTSKPMSDRQKSLGRFIAKTPAFLDPEIYQKGLRITFVGNISTSLEGKVGERPYIYPVINAKAHHLWPKHLYRPYRYVAPGFWYYGFHPYWRFGYPFYGYGVWNYDVFYPYYPVYGYLHRSNNVIPRGYASGDFRFSASLNWPHNHLYQWRNNLFWNGMIYNNSRYGNYRDTTNRNQNYTRNRNTNNATRAAKPSRAYQSRPVTPRRKPQQSEK